MSNFHFLHNYLCSFGKICSTKLILVCYYKVDAMTMRSKAEIICIMCITYKEVIDHWLPKMLCSLVNTLRPRQNARHFANDFFRNIFVNKILYSD